MTATRMSDLSGRADAASAAGEPNPRGCPGNPTLSSVVRILQTCSPARGNGSPSAPWILLVCATGLVLGAGCGPIEAERPEARAPYIDPETVSPEQRVISVSDGTEGEELRLFAQAFDPNREDVLNAVWTTESETLGFPVPAELARLGTADNINGEEYYEYEPAEIDVTPCQIADAGEKETIWLYVADRGFQNVDENDITVRSGGHLVSQTWVLKLEDGACEQ